MHASRTRHHFLWVGLWVENLQDGSGRKVNPDKRYSVCGHSRTQERAQPFDGTEPERLLVPACEHERSDRQRPMKRWRAASRQITKASGYPNCDSTNCVMTR
jgi:hypothetical protein